MTVAVTIERLRAGLALIRKHAERGWPPPTNYQLAVAIGMGDQNYQPHDRMRGVCTNGMRLRKPEAGAVVIKALELMGRIRVERIGRNRRRIEIIEG
jgi:hypothetical protein